MVQKAVELGVHSAVPLSARLETRTKESMELAGLQVQSAKPQGVVKATLSPDGVHTERSAGATGPEVQWTGF
jgi:hypothetical protein